MTCSGTIGRAMRAIFSEGRPASISFSPVTLSAAANAIYRDRNEELASRDYNSEEEIDLFVELFHFVRGCLLNE